MSSQSVVSAFRLSCATFLLFAWSPGLLADHNIESQKVLGDGAANDRFGFAVAIEGDTLLVGAPGEGSVHVFRRNAANQFAFDQKILPESEPVFDRFAGKIALSSGTAVVVVTGGEDRVFVFTEDANGDWSEEQKLVDPDEGLSIPRYSADVSGDFIVVGDIRDDETRTNGGAAFVFRRVSPGNWVEEEKLLGDAGDACCQPEFGLGVAISGNTVVVGARNEHTGQANTGAAYVFVRDEFGTWSRQDKLLANDGAGADFFGESVDIVGDIAVVAAPRDDPACPQDPGNCNSGSAYVFERTGGSTWTQTQKLVASDNAASDFFGLAISLSGSRLLASSGNDAAGLNAGAAYTFTRGADGQWQEHEKILASDAAQFQAFSSSVDLDGNQAVIGASNDSGQATNAGAAYVYQPAADLILRNSMDNRWFNYQLSGSAILDKGRLSLTRSPAYSVVSRSDFDGDGGPDLLVRDLTPNRDENGRWVLYTFAGATVTSEGFMGNGLTRNSNWQLVSDGDFDNDSKADLLLRNGVDGRWLLYLLDGRSIKGQGILAMSTDAGDVIQGFGDFNADGRHDALLRRADGTWLLYLLDGLNTPAESNPTLTPNLAFSFQSLGDFNGDGNDDVLVRRTDGQWFMYLMDGSSVLDSGPPNFTKNTTFTIRSVADYSGDGKADVLLRRADGRWFMYLLDGLSIDDSGEPAFTKNTDYSIVNTNNYNQDGTADVLMRRTDGRWVVYLMDGLAIIDQGPTDMTRNPAWIPY